MRIPIANDAYTLIISLVVIALSAGHLTQSIPVLGFFLGLAVFVCFFFRDPERPLTASEKELVSPADGRIMNVIPTQLDGKPYNQIVIFLSVFNCHINRIPFSGTVKETSHIPGKFLAAYRNEIDKKNERQETLIETKHGLIKVVQITGAIARRIVCRLQAGQSVSRGDRFGLIKFGSRTDLYVPQSADVLVKKGDVVKGNLTTMARFK